LFSPTPALFTDTISSFQPPVKPTSRYPGSRGFQNWPRMRWFASKRIRWGGWDDWSGGSRA